VTGVQIPLSEDLTWITERAYMSGSPSGSGLPTVPFHRFTLKPGQGRDLIVTMTFGPCPAGLTQISGNEGDSVFSGASVTSSAFGVNHATLVRTDRTVLSVQGWPGCKPLSP
jgi:hypothetical protein